MASSLKRELTRRKLARATSKRKSQRKQWMLNNGTALGNQNEDKEEIKSAAAKTRKTSISEASKKDSPSKKSDSSR